MCFVPYLQFILKPYPLQHVCLVFIIIFLWNQTDIRALVVKSNFSMDYLHKSQEWKAIEEKIIKKVEKLSLPKMLKQKLSNFITPIGVQIIEWVQCHCICFDRVFFPSTKLYWTSGGTVDKKRTAEKLVKDKNLEMSSRYRLACIYCLEDEIQILWNIMPEALKDTVSHKFPIIQLWLRIMKSKELGQSFNSYKNEFEECIQLKNKVAAEYFLQKLTPSERKLSLLQKAKTAEDPPTLCFLLSVMDQQQQSEIFQNNSYEILCCFLQWPLHCYFIDTARCIFSYLQNEIFENVLIGIVMKISGGYKDFNNQAMFSEFWQTSPDALKHYITNEIDESHLLASLFHIKDIENIKRVMKDVSFIVKKNYL